MRICNCANSPSLQSFFRNVDVDVDGWMVGEGGYGKSTVVSVSVCVCMYVYMYTKCTVLESLPNLRKSVWLLVVRVVSRCFTVHLTTPHNVAITPYMY